MQETLSTGVVVTIKPVSVFLIQRVKDRLEPQRPKVPTKYIPEDDKTIEIPEDPAYQKAIEDFEDKRIEAVMDAAMVMGTEIESVPAGVYRPEDSGWLDKLVDLLGFASPKSQDERYLMWLKYYAAPTVDDSRRISTAVMRLIGVPESEVAAAAASFRGGT